MAAFDENQPAKRIFVYYGMAVLFGADETDESGEDLFLRNGRMKCSVREIK